MNSSSLNSQQVNTVPQSDVTLYDDEVLEWLGKARYLETPHFPR